MSKLSPALVLAFVTHGAFAAQAEGEGPLAQAPAVPAGAAVLEEGAVDVHRGISFSGRVVGVPALLIGGACLGTGLHALAVSDALGASGLGGAGYWTQLGGLIAIAVSLLPLIVGEIGLGAGALGDLFTALDLTAADAEAAGMAWARLATWELAAHTGALGAGLTVGGVLSLITSIVLPTVFLFDHAGVTAFDQLLGLSVTTTVVGLVVVVLAAVLAGVSVWLSGAVTAAYKRAAGGGSAALKPLPAGRVARGSASSSPPAMAY